MGRVSHQGLLAVVVALGVAALIGVALLWPSGDPTFSDPPVGQSSELVNARIVEVVPLLDEDPIGLLPDAIPIEVTARLEATGEEVTFEMVDDTGDTFRAGQSVRLAAIEQEGLGTTYYVSDFRRDRPLALLALLFIAAVVGFGRFQGVRALLGLVFTFVVIIGFIVPAILDGRSPVAVALVGAVLVMIVTLYLSHGFSPKTTAAVVGTAGALVLTGVLAAGFVTAASLTGFTSEEARLANLQVGGLSLQGLLLAGIIIGGLGVLDDVTMSQASTVLELHRANPLAKGAELVRGALNVGRDHIAATVNTLFLAYAGAALPLLILFTTSQDSIGTILTSEIVAVEIVRTLVGSLGLIAAVPLTSALAAALTVPGSPVPEAPQAASVLDDPVPQAANALGDPGQSSGQAPVQDAPEDPEWEARLREAYGLPERPPERRSD